jgi:hypothetical protein
MALAVVHVDGASDPAHTGNAVTPSWTSVANSLLVVVGATFNATGSPVNGDVTDNQGNTYTVGPGAYGGAGNEGLGLWYSNATTRGAGHTVTFHPLSGAPSDTNISVVEITGQDLTSAVYDTTTKAAGTDGVSPYNITAAAAISGNQIAVYGAVVVAFANSAWTAPGGYSNIFNQPDAANFLGSDAAYKINETGTPTVGATRGEATTAGREVFATFKEAVSAVVTTGNDPPIGLIGRGAGW